LSDIDNMMVQLAFMYNVISDRVRDRVSSVLRSVREFGLVSRVRSIFELSDGQEILARLVVLYLVLLFSLSSSLIGVMLLILSMLRMSIAGVILSSIAIVFGLGIAYLSYILLSE
jgi:hypothetical protein